MPADQVVPCIKGLVHCPDSGAKEQTFATVLQRAIRQTIPLAHSPYPIRTFHLVRRHAQRVIESTQNLGRACASVNRPAIMCVRSSSGAHCRRAIWTVITNRQEPQRRRFESPRLKHTRQLHNGSRSLAGARCEGASRAAATCAGGKASAPSARCDRDWK
jgi:hypothetical protein